MLINAGIVLHYASLYRCIYIDGRYGGGKTALAFKLAIELQKRREYYYILSNTKSIVNDKPEDVVMRDGQYVDAVIVLDEGGLFLETNADVKKWMFALRKLNISIIIPSVEPPHSRMTKLTIQRLMNWQVFGLPVWTYGWILRSGQQKQKGMFHWLFPEEIYGIYDTQGVPVDAGYISGWVATWAERLQQTTGYERDKGKVIELPEVSGSDGESRKLRGTSAVTYDTLAEFARTVDTFKEVQDNLSDLVPVLTSRKIRGR